MTPYALLRTRLSAVRPLAAPTRQGRRAAAIRAERAARPTATAPLITACCTTWPATSGHHHKPTCHNATEETDRA